MADAAEGFRIRRAESADHGAFQDICLKTGDSGGDGTDLHDSPDLLGLVYAVPYQVFAPEFAFALEDDAGVCGYAFGVADTTAFQLWLDQTWFPPLRARLDDPGPDATVWRKSDWVRARIFAPLAPFPVDPVLYPAHGHIDLLPRAQGRGLGRRMMGLVMTALSAAGAPGMFLEVSPRNPRAQGFYQGLGFRRLIADLPGLDAVLMGRSLEAGTF